LQWLQDPSEINGDNLNKDVKPADISRGKKDGISESLQRTVRKEHHRHVKKNK
jgi:hypothetical protein